MYYCTESDLNIKSVGQLKDVYGQIGCTQVIADKRVKANWLEAILTHQSAQVTKSWGWIPTKLKLDDSLRSNKKLPQSPTIVQSGSLIFKPVECASAKSAYEVWNGEINYGVIKMLVDGLWVHAYAPTTKYGTPYQSAAALVEAVQIREARSLDIQVLEHWDEKFVVRNNQNGCETRRREYSPRAAAFGGKLPPKTCLQISRYYVVQPNHPEPKEHCECGDCHYRAVVCKHQIAVVDHAQIESLRDDIEVDSISDPDFGLMYRVWKSWELLGTFYHALDGKWVAQPCDSDTRPRCETANHAQLLILAIAGLLVAGEVCGTAIFCPASFT
ncbi:MAG: hypothetical protein PUP91_28610 [Rhizonema sp. PD37]|nr:hypothetical protein [Rhizonema sp. PD37]